MKVESLVAGALMSVTEQARSDGGDPHAVLLMVDTVSGDHSLQALTARGEDAVPLCCALLAVFRAFVMRRPDLGLLLQAELAAVLELAKPAGSRLN